jgi:hypothetical protein
MHFFSSLEVTNSAEIWLSLLRDEQGQAQKDLPPAQEFM